MSDGAKWLYVILFSLDVTWKGLSGTGGEVVLSQFVQLSAGCYNCRLYVLCILVSIEIKIILGEVSGNHSLVIDVH